MHKIRDIIRSIFSTHSPSKKLAKAVKDAMTSEEMQEMIRSMRAERW